MTQALSELAIFLLGAAIAIGLLLALALIVGPIIRKVFHL